VSGAVVLVEGVSDQRASRRSPLRLGRDLAAERVAVVPIGGSKNIRAYLDRFGPHGSTSTSPDCATKAEVDDFRRGLERAGSRCGLEVAAWRRSFLRVQCDLEDELIRSLAPMPSNASSPRKASSGSSALAEAARSRVAARGPAARFLGVARPADRTDGCSSTRSTSPGCRPTGACAPRTVDAGCVWLLGLRCAALSGTVR